MAAPEQLKRIAFCITDLDPGGAEKILVQLATRLDSQRWQPHVFCLSSRGPLAEDLEQAEVPVTCLGARYWWQIWTIIPLAIHLRKFRPDLLQTFLFHANILGRIAGRLAGIKRIVSGIRVAEKRSRLPLFVDRWTNWLVLKNVCVSNSVKEFSIQQGGLSEKKTTCIPNGVDLLKFQNANPADLSELGIPLQSRIILSVGRLDHQKNPQLLLQAVEDLISKYDDLHLLFVGDGPEISSLKQSISSRELQDRIHLAGWRSDIPALLNAAYCFALPSRWEGMPNVILEAMSAGLPIVATRVEGTDDLIHHKSSGLLVESDAVEELRSALDYFFSNPEIAQEMGAQSQEIARKHFTIEKMVSSYESLFTSLLGS